MARIGCPRHLGVNLVVSVLCAVALTCLGGLFVPSNARADGYYNVDDHGVTYNVYDNDNGVATLMDIKDPKVDTEVTVPETVTVNGKTLKLSEAMFRTGKGTKSHITKLNITHISGGWYSSNFNEYKGLTELTLGGGAESTVASRISLSLKR